LSELTSHEKYQGAKKYEFPYTNDESGFLSEYGQTKFYQPAAYGKEGIMLMNDIQGVTGGFAFANGGMAAAEYAKATGNGVVSATYVVDFATADGHGGKWSSSASVKVGQSLAVTTGSFKIVKDQTSTFNAGTGNAFLGQPIQSDKIFGEVENTTSTAMNVTQEALNVVSVLGGMGTNRSKNFEMKADPAKYKSNAIELLKDTNKELISKGASLR
jgi:hypothetical protein